VDNTTDGTIDAVAASIIDAPAEEQRVEDAEIVEETPAEEIPTEEAEEAETADTDEAEDASDEYDDQEDEEADEEPDGQLYTVKVDGKTKQVTLDELRRGYSGQAYIQQSMEQLANAKKQMQEMYQVLQTEKQQVQEAFQRVQSGQGLTAPTPPSKELFDKDPIGYMQAKIEYDEQLAQYEQTQAQMRQMQQQEVQRSQAQHQAYLQQQLQVLQQKIPEFADPKKAPAYRDKILQAGQEYGFTVDEMQQTADSRYIEVLNDAMKWRELQASRGEVTQKAQSARPVVKPGVKRDGRTSKQKQTREAAARMRKTGDIEDVAKFLLS
jgi:hypothetical protein